MVGKHGHRNKRVSWNAGSGGGLVASFRKYLRPSLYVIPAKLVLRESGGAGIYSASLPEFAAYKLESRFRGNDVSLVRNEGSDDATT